MRRGDEGEERHDQQREARLAEHEAHLPRDHGDEGEHGQQDDPDVGLRLEDEDQRRRDGRAEQRAGDRAQGAGARPARRPAGHRERGEHDPEAVRERERPGHGPGQRERQREPHGVVQDDGVPARGWRRAAAPPAAPARAPTGAGRRRVATPACCTTASAVTPTRAVANAARVAAPMRSWPSARSAASWAWLGIGEGPRAPSRGRRADGGRRPSPASASAARASSAPVLSRYTRSATVSARGPARGGTAPSSRSSRARPGPSRRSPISASAVPVGRSTRSRAAVRVAASALARLGARRRDRAAVGIVAASSAVARASGRRAWPSRRRTSAPGMLGPQEERRRDRAGAADGEPDQARRDGRVVGGDAARHDEDEDQGTRRGPVAFGPGERGQRRRPARRRT